MLCLSQTYSGPKSHEPFFNVFLMEAGVMSFLAYCTLFSGGGGIVDFSGFSIIEVFRASELDTLGAFFFLFQKTFCNRFLLEILCL